LWQILRFLGEMDQSLGSQRPDGDAPIHFACMYGHEECVRVICSFAKNVASPSPDRDMLDDGVEEGHENAAIAGDILDPDGIVPVNLNVVNNNGSSPAHLAALKGHTKVSASHISLPPMPKLMNVFNRFWLF
jgi:ankyrin repeat protein